MMKNTIISGVMILIYSCTNNQDDMNDKEREDDKKAIAEVVADYVTYWNKNDMDSWGVLFTDDVDYVNRGGGWWRSKKENVEGHKRIHQMLVSQDQNMTFNLEVSSITFLKPDIALVHVLSTWPGFRSPGGNDNHRNTGGIMTIIMVKEDGNWLIRALQNTLRKSET